MFLVKLRSFSIHFTRLPFASRTYPENPMTRLTCALCRSHLLPETCHRILFVRPWLMCLDR